MNKKIIGIVIGVVIIIAIAAGFTEYERLSNRHFSEWGVKLKIERGEHDGDEQYRHCAELLHGQEWTAA